VKELVFLLEEGSAKALLQAILPSLTRTQSRFIVFEGKQDLHRQLERKLRGYLNPKARFIVLQDQDATDCRKLKKSLALLCSRARKPETIVRIACRELESFYLGDLRAVESGLGLTGLARWQNRAKYRDPDRLHAPSRELARLTEYGYQKIAGSRAIAPHLDLESPRSRSFYHLLQAIRKAGAD
jgi:hypothetical protein